MGAVPIALGRDAQFQSDIAAVAADSGACQRERVTGGRVLPRLCLTELTLQNEANEGSAPEASLRIDPWQSIIGGALRFDELTLIAPTIDWVAPGDERCQADDWLHFNSFMTRFATPKSYWASTQCA